jgi:hypothetical protein
VKSERDRSGTTEAANGGEGDGANSPTRATKKIAALLKVLLFFLAAKRLAQRKNKIIVELPHAPNIDFFG